jgi:hypothetical protein
MIPKLPQVHLNPDLIFLPPLRYDVHRILVAVSGIFATHLFSMALQNISILTAGNRRLYLAFERFQTGLGGPDFLSDAGSVEPIPLSLRSPIMTWFSS